MKEFLSRTGRRFSVRLVDEDEAAYDALVALGFRSVPVTVIGDRTVVGFNREELERALAGAAEP